MTEKIGKQFIIAGVGEFTITFKPAEVIDFDKMKERTIGIYFNRTLRDILNSLEES